ncbi:MAG: amidohydrolase [Actinomycetia bacterium]|nr:amidohydrolase [Actinomycetes bacterium]
MRTLVSADSHVIEPVALWEGVLPEGFWPGDPTASFSGKPGGFDPHARVAEMEVDGVSAEVLYPSLAMTLFTEQPAVQRACFARYNDWIAEYCSVAPERLVGIGLLAVHDIDAAVAEAQRSAELGLRGVMIWQVPPTELAFNSGHYEPLWEACSDLGLPVNLHILTGYGYGKEITDHRQALGRAGDLAFKLIINGKLHAVTDALTEIVMSGAFDRHPGLRLMLVENEVGWLPFFMDQLDFYYDKFRAQTPVELSRMPTEILRDQVFATFFRDPAAAYVAGVFENIMWSSDYPHSNSTWPDSQQVVEDRIGHLPEEQVARLVRGTVSDLYHIELPESSVRA